MKKVLDGDLLTPILAYMRLDGSRKMILESIPRDAENARYSIVAHHPVKELRYEAGVFTLDGEVLDADPLDYLQEITVAAKKERASLPFQSGAIGYVAYDLLGLYEDLGAIPQDPIGTPDLHFYLYESYVIFDHKKEQVLVVEDNVYTGRSQAEMEVALEKTLADLRAVSDLEFKEKQLAPLEFEPHISKGDFMDMVETARNYIRQGDMFQCVLSQRFSSKFSGEPLDYYRKLRVTNPSNYLYFYDFGDYQIIGASPESLVSVKGNQVVTNPIAGTRPRGRDEEEDLALVQELSQDEKEVAEHRMLVDLGRNDIGRVSEIGSVRVTKYMEVERFRYVMHLTSLVRGRLKKGLTGMDALKATLPAGTVSGAPKIRAMQRIYELEREKRGIYAGAIGYLSSNGDLDLAITIRTMVIKNGRAYVQAGAGVVYDSDPEKEYLETLNKAKAMTGIGEER